MTRRRGVFEGQTIKVEVQDNGIAELRFDRANEAVNKLNALAFDELRRALESAGVEFADGDKPACGSGRPRGGRISG